MQLNLEQIESVTRGAVRITEENGFRFYRFTADQEEIYRKLHERLLFKTYATSGICMEFLTDTDRIFMDVDFAEGSTRTYYAFDVFCDGKKEASIANFDSEENLVGTKFPLENIKKEIRLPKGEKRVRIVFPWSVAPILREISIDDTSFIRPAPEREKMMLFGDSISQGYDARYPCESYAWRLSEKMNVDLYNKAIGGEMFFPELLEARMIFPRNTLWSPTEQTTGAITPLKNSSGIP